MPSIWTHIIFGEELLKRILLDHLSQDPRTGPIFRLGCQGPDILFYYRFWPWMDGSKGKTLGDAIHHRHCGPFLMRLLQDVQGTPLAEPLAAYTLGFLTHHLLDRTMHPYVYYKSGLNMDLHMRFEMIMDVLIVKEKLGVDAWDAPVWKQIAFDELPEDIPIRMKAAADDIFPELARGFTLDMWKQSYRDIVLAQKLFHDPSGIKRALTFGRLTPYVYKRHEPQLDYLNLERTVWNCPTDANETFMHSVWDLWENAINEGVELLREAAAVLEQPNNNHATDWSRLVGLIGDFSYDTGKPWDRGLTIQFVQPMIG